MPAQPYNDEAEVRLLEMIFLVLQLRQIYADSASHMSYMCHSSALGEGLGREEGVIEGEGRKEREGG